MATISRAPKLLAAILLTVVIVVAVNGPDGTARDYPGSFEGTPVFIGCSDVDPHIAKARVIEAGDVLKRMGAKVTVQLYPNMAHTVNADEIHSAAQIVEAVAHEVA